MNKKIILGMIMMLSLITIPIGLSYSESQVITQSQLNNVNITEFDFSPEFTNSKTQIIASCFIPPGGICNVKYEYLSARKEVIKNEESWTETGKYVITLIKRKVKIYLSWFVIIKVQYNSTIAKQEMKKYVKSQTDNQFERERGEIKDYQTNEISYIEDMFGGFEF